MSSSTPVEAPDPKIDPITLPLLIALCIFTPSLLAITGYFIYLHTVKKCEDKKQRAKQDDKAATGIVREMQPRGGVAADD
ncbi:uncharacterized protein M421DRAFT_8373 [Didymella exigua CBS 183.55]|uniref:Uncharacterized protein n=1 Tax=Didymella exigua CBS 183.55 TaxID=1150837 RepID=A0A6A5RC24_9PLEO|nr:uncharacterized protein M421DRAFT_8373 [Didymella exigua CBS 183.55]KAF1924929.1 hypothetical protein M421DRAFT_8373 [Didymella exigua CBS 183.55]